MARPRTVEQLQEQLDDLVARRRELRESHSGPFRDEHHQLLDTCWQEARDAAAQYVGTGRHVAFLPVDDHAKLRALEALAGDDAYWAAAHAAVDEAEGFEEISRAELDSRLGEISSQIAAINADLAKRPIVAEIAALEAELSALGGVEEVAAA
jgi:hypothetical protein